MNPQKLPNFKLLTKKHANKKTNATENVTSLMKIITIKLKYFFSLSLSLLICGNNRWDAAAGLTNSHASFSVAANTLCLQGSLSFRCPL